MDYTLDCIFNGKIKLKQPAIGYRTAIDPIILCDFVTLKNNQKILDVGCGAGLISLILKHTADKTLLNTDIIGIDIDNAFCELYNENAKINNLQIQGINKNLEEFSKDMNKNCIFFDQIITNPPYFEVKSSRLSETKRNANFETMQLTSWIKCCLNILKNNGTFSIIHNAEKINDILFALKNIAGAIEIIPIYSKSNSIAKRVVVRCKKAAKTATAIHHGIIVHNQDGTYSNAMQKILSGK